MSFWDEINAVLAPASAKSITGDVPQEYANDGAMPSFPDGYNPDSTKSNLDARGYQPSTPSTPTYGLDGAAIVDISQRNPSPFTVIDLTPGLDNGKTAITGAFGSGGNIKNRFPVSPATIKKVADLVNMPVIALSNFFGAGGQMFGLTYELRIVGNSLRVDRLAQGYKPLSEIMSGTLRQNPSLGLDQIQGAGPITDVGAQNALAILLSGCFIQFESLDAALMTVSPGETFDLPFSTIYVTVFGSGGRWRLTAGNNARVKSQSNDRILRSKL